MWLSRLSVTRTHETRRKLAAFITTAVLVLGIAQLGSYLVHTYLPLDQTYVVNSLVHFTHIRNTGAVFGIFPGNSTVFAITSALVFVGLCIYVLNNVTLELYQCICFGFIVGAAASNTCDRLFYGAVIDFIYVQGIPHWNYIFNIADAAIHVGAWPLFIGSLLRPHLQSERAPAQRADVE